VPSYDWQQLKKKILMCVLQNISLFRETFYRFAFSLFREKVCFSKNKETEIKCFINKLCQVA
jgi:hypothetical protein